MASQSGGGDSGGGGGGGGGGGLGSDPSVLMALNMQKTGNAQIDAMLKALRERAIIAFGDPGIAGVGFNLDPATKAQTQANYDSGNATLARLVHGNDLARQGIINSLAAHGILHSGDLGYREAEQGRAYGNQTYDARQSLIDYLTKAAQDALDRRNALQMAVNNAYLSAYSNGYGGGGGGGGFGGGGGGLENPDQFNTGFSGEDINAAAAAYASGRSYNGSAYQPGMVMQEGHVEYRNGIPGVYIKYRTANGDSTEWTPINPASSGGGGGGGNSGGGGGGGGGGGPAPAPPPATAPNGMPLDAYGFPDFTRPWG